VHAAKEKLIVPTQNGPIAAQAELAGKDGLRREVSPEWIRLQELALRQLDRFMALEPKVLRGEDPEAIHDMRVASRRLQQVLDLVYPPSAPREVRRLRRRIQRCRRALGEVRNCDVLLQRFEKSLASKRNSQRDIWQAASEYVQQRRSDSFGKALRKLGKANLAFLYVELKGHLALNGAGPAHGIRNSGSGVREETRNPDPEIRTPSSFYERVARSMESAWKEFVEKVDEAHRQPQASALHGVRIAAKRLRYLVEVIEEFDVPGSRESIAWLRGLQQHLGDWHDREVLEGVLTGMIARPKFIRDHLEMTSGVLRLIRRNRQAKKKFEEKYLQATRHSAEYERTKRWAVQLSSSPAAVFPFPV
jgi:CHAD domain-containing protein